MRNVIAVLIMPFLLCFGCSAQVASSLCGPVSQGATDKTVITVAPEKMRDVLVDTYRLQPDKRFLLAVAEVHNFLSGEKRDKVFTEFQDGHWKICYGKRFIGYLPELPDFKDSLELLANWATTLQKRYPLKLSSTSLNETTIEIDKTVNQFSTPSLTSGLQKMNDLWRNGERNPALLHSATRALVYLTLQSLDRLETADVVPAKALAVLAITKTFTDYDTTREESLLAYTLDYSAHAVVVGNTLHESDAVRSYVNRNDKLLMEIAMEPGSSVESHYLYLLRLAYLKNVEAFRSWIMIHFPRTWPSLPVFKAGLDLDSFSLNPYLTEALPRLILLTLAQEAGILPDMVEQFKGEAGKNYSDNELKAITVDVIKIFSAKQSILTDVFESGLKMLDRKYSGPFLDPTTYQAYYTGYFFSSLHILGLHYLDELSSVEAANRFAGILGTANTGIAADFHRWYRNLAKSKEGKADINILMNDMIASTNLGVAPLMRTYEEQKIYYGFADPVMLKAIKLMIQRFDSRMQHRFHLGDMAYSDMLDLKLANNIYQSILKTSPEKHEYLQAWHANFTGDRKRLRDSFNAMMGFGTRVKILEFLENKKDMDEKTLIDRYRQLIKENPDSWYVRSQYAEHLEKTEQYAEAREIMEDWLKRNVETTGLESLESYVVIARMYSKEKNYKQGWKVIQPFIESQKGSVMGIAAELLDKLGKKDDAEKMGQRVVGRYPASIEWRASLAGLYWRHGKYGEAAALLQSSPHRLGMMDWQFTIAPKFAEIFADRPKEDILSAFSAILAKGFGHMELLLISFPFSNAGKNDIAFELVSPLKWNGLGNMEFVIQGYSNLKAWKGKESALDWVRQKVPAQLLDPSSMIIYDHKEFELLWDLIQKPKHGEDADFVWLMRAAASLRIGKNKDPHYEELVAYYKKKPNGYYNDLGRFLMGMITEKEALSLATDSKKRCEIAYYIGLKAQAEGRYEDASDWFRVAIETGLINNGEYRWAFNVLYKWKTSGKDLTQLQSEKEN